MTEPSRTGRQGWIAALGAVSLLTVSGLLTLPMPAAATVPATVPTTVPTTTTTVPNQTAIISVTNSPPAPSTAPVAAAPAPTAPATGIIFVGPPPETPAPAPAPLPAPQVALPLPGRVPGAPVVSSPRHVPAALEAAAVRRRELNARVVETEANVVVLEGEVASADAEVGDMRSQSESLTARLDAAQDRLHYEKQASPAPSTVLAVPPPAPAKPARKSPVAAVWQKAVELSRSVLPDPPASAVIVADGVRDRQSSLRRQAELSASADALGRQLEELEGRAAAAEVALAAKTQELSDARRSLAEARNALSAAIADVTFGPQALGATLGSTSVDASRFAVADIPAEYLALYQEAATACPGLSWTVLAAVGATESAHGRTNAPGVRDGANFAGAMGPMQFLSPTWAAYGVDGNRDGTADVYNPTDAVYGAANYLCANGAADPARVAGALWAYNQADWYVRKVLEQAIRYGAAGLHAASVDPAALLANANLLLSPQAGADLAAGKVDRRVTEVLAAMAGRHRISVSVIETGHSMHVKGTDRVSNHYYGRAVDIYEVDGAPVSAANDGALELAVALLTADASIRPDEFGSPWPELGHFPGAFTDADHLGHLHLGWNENAPEFHQAKESGQ